MKRFVLCLLSIPLVGQICANSIEPGVFLSEEDYKEKYAGQMIYYPRLPFRDMSKAEIVFWLKILPQRYVLKKSGRRTGKQIYEAVVTRQPVIHGYSDTDSSCQQYGLSQVIFLNSNKKRKKEKRAHAASAQHEPKNFKPRRFKNNSVYYLKKEMLLIKSAPFLIFDVVQNSKIVGERDLL